MVFAFAMQPVAHRLRRVGSSFHACGAARLRFNPTEIGLYDIARQEYGRFGMRPCRFGTVMISAALRSAACN